MIRPATFYGWLLLACLIGSCADRQRREAGAVVKASMLPILAAKQLIATQDTLAAVRDSLRQERADLIACYQSMAIADTAYFVPGRDSILWHGRFVR